MSAAAPSWATVRMDSAGQPLGHLAPRPARARCWRSACCSSRCWRGWRRCARPMPISAICSICWRAARRPRSQDLGTVGWPLHRMVAEAAHNKLLLSLFDAFNAMRSQKTWGQLRQAALTAERRDVYCRHHRAYVAAIAKRDPARAEDLMRRHIEAVRDGSAGGSPWSPADWQRRRTQQRPCRFAARHDAGSGDPADPPSPRRPGGAQPRGLARQVDHACGALRALGVRRADRVAMVLPNGPEMAVAVSRRRRRRGRGPPQPRLSRARSSTSISRISRRSCC